MGLLDAAQANNRAAQEGVPQWLLSPRMVGHALAMRSCTPLTLPSILALLFHRVIFLARGPGEESC